MISRKYFKGKTDDEIKAKRREIVERIKVFMEGESFRVIDSLFEKSPHDANPLWFLGKSLELMATADYVFFTRDWSTTMGCRIENQCAQEYGLQTIYECLLDQTTVGDTYG